MVCARIDIRRTVTAAVVLGEVPAVHKAAAGLVIVMVLALGFGFYSGILQVDSDALERSVREIDEAFPDDIVDGVIESVSETVPDIESPMGAPIVTADPPVPGLGFDNAVIERHIYEFTNDYRRGHGLAGLVRMPAIDDIARAHSADMADRQYFSHDTPEGLDPSDRARTAGFDCGLHGSPYIGLGENIFQGYTDASGERGIARETVDGWMDSPGHRQNILDPDYGFIGVGVAINTFGQVYSVQNFC